MRTKFTLIILLLLSYKGFSQTKPQTIKIINQVLQSAVGGTDKVKIKGKELQLKIISNSFLIDEDGKTGHFKSKLQGEGNTSAHDTSSSIAAWKGFKVSTDIKSTTLGSIYPITEKRLGEPDDDKNGIRYYCLAGNEEQLITALMHLKSLYSKN